jgi:hypothetical protein
VTWAAWEIGFCAADFACQETTALGIAGDDMNQAGSLPHFVVIGAQKSGTSWLREQLLDHPEVFVPDGKELDFFFRDSTEAWYRSQFAAAPPGTICGDISPNYLPRYECCERMRDLIPSAKLICILRNPIYRAFSQWKMARQLGNVPKDISFIDAFRQDLRYIRKQGEYISLLDHWARFFNPDERTLVLFHDDVASSPAEVMERVLLYLGVSRGVVQDRLHEVVNASEDRQRMAPEDAIEVSAYYRSSIEALARRFDRDLSHWTEPMG